MSIYPDSLINEFARNRCVLFLGAGVSATARSEEGKCPPSWKEFIEGALSLVKVKKHRIEARRYLKLGNNTLALQVISNSIDRADYISYVERTFNNPKYKPSEVHKHVHLLGSKIVITTNFDLIYENYCRSISDSGFKVVTYDNKTLSDVIRSDSSIIIKSHGSVDDTSRMIFLKSQYHKAKNDHWKFYEILKSIFLTNTVLFLGCGMTDPDLLEVLEDVKITASQEKPHYLLTTFGQSEAVKRDLIESYNVATIPYGKTIDDFPRAIEELKKLVLSTRERLGIA